ncbi:MAG: hypothetical protein Q8P77_01820, partial [Candidatus Veblenbacteria bacterium]|nr:hypothetical protein [Candidatus Veblenbacteria bacterium]
MVTVTDRIQNWNTWPWTFAGTTKAIVNSNDTIPHTVSLRLRNSSGEIVYDWESNVNLIPGDWSYSVPFLWWVQTTRELLLIDFEPGTYTLVATLRATGYMDDSIEVEFSIDS